ncbi:putative BNR2 super family [Candidatus Termititenax persephonae]|uniref:BNR2 super family n=1 Tax=Candidatus Termititenax persephonae TaxID=2218525 RepID=A0A388TI76_9BACT|nr:putative BNR2 super family [Candidatus Termititenax persephonae]
MRRGLRISFFFGLLLGLVLAAETVRLPNLAVHRPVIFTRAAQHSVRQGDSLHLVYLDTRDGRDKNVHVFYLRSRDGGISWDKPVQLSKDVAAESAQILISAGGRLSVFYAAGGAIYLVDSADPGTGWSEPYKISARQTRAKNPSAVIAGAGDIHVVWENAGMIYYRRYAAGTKTWENISDISNEASAAPLIVNYANSILYTLWLQKGEVVCRPLDLTKNLWSPWEEVSAEAQIKLNTSPGACRDLAAAVDSQNNLYVLWSNGQQLVSRVRDSGIWSGIISRMTSNYVPGIAPSVVFDVFGRVFIAYVENNKIVLCQYDSRTHLWAKNLLFGLDEQKAFTALAVGGNTSYNDLLPSYQQGYDFFWAEREPQKNIGTLAFNNRSAETGGTRSALPEKNNGPELELIGITVEDSFYMHSPHPATLYFGGLLPGRKSFEIRGRIKQRGDGLRRLNFSAAFGILPPSLFPVGDGEWSVRYFVEAVDEPTDITITAYDTAGNATTRVVSVLKDTLPPLPPTWVRTGADKSVSANPAVDEPKFSNSQQIFVTWTDGQDNGVGVRGHRMGTKNRWWQNAEHRSGDTELGSEGENIFYVYAVDRVGNVSLPGTDKIFVDSTPPAAPELDRAVTSANYFYGTCAVDTAVILVNGLADQDMSIVTPGIWQYRHKLGDGQRQLVRLQAIDYRQNKGPVAEFWLSVDRTPPQVARAEHNADGKTLRVKDSLVVTAQSEPGGSAVLHIQGLAENIPLREENGVYTGMYTIDSDQTKGQYAVSLIVRDAAGNPLEKKLKPVSIDSWAELAVDDFEEYGDFYSWKNHATAWNINALDKNSTENISPPVGRGALRVEYDLAAAQFWAGIAAREFSPRNYYGQRPALQFWLKGSGLPTGRVAVQLLHKNSVMAQNIYLGGQDLLYTAPLTETQWKKYSIFIPADRLDGLEQTNRYAVYVQSADSADRGVFYLDDLRIVYHQPPPQEPEKPAGDLESSTKPQEPERPSDNPEADTEDAESGAVLTAPYLAVELTPPVLTRGQRQQVKISVPPGLRVVRAYVVWGRVNQVLQTTPLTDSGLNVYQGEYQPPPDLRLGEQEGLVFVQTQNGQLYKKSFYYRVLAPGGQNVAEQLAAHFYPHPLLPGKDVRVRVSLPESVQSRQVMVFLAEDQSKVAAVMLRKENGVWQGVFALPEDTPPGVYSASIICKTEDGSFIKKKIKYSVYK